ncbi:pyridine nucleotide-disulfide oxidoreductase [Paenarthrobacter ureafaciens]|uniref:dihydrolipoyl dehydrogenase family protein n=1 Tax=Paenarthrobacter ureafaciens TaxID=37931 RepID=UPI0015B98626|nr:NAD(P)/FAD-dependent oxidoreductase [Paenarthrobacter ureafaciens]NWL28747.1 pyridine nucleotide-disulfide oxidoreductase [Paenarthrobacter ureafaciens]
MTAENSREFDVIVIGAGAVGENVADRVVQGGLSAVVIEAELVGGECSYWACVPSKALLRSGSALHAAQLIPGATEAITGVLDAEAALKHRDWFTNNWQDGSQVEWLESTGIELIRGRGRITGPREVQVDGLDGNSYALKAHHAVVIATGSSPTVPDAEGLSDVPFWTTRGATAAKKIPRRLAVLGGGVAGVELAQAFARLGSMVTLIARSRLLGSYPEEAAALVLAGLRADGVAVHLHTDVDKVEKDDDGSLTITFDGSTVSADELLVASGRHPALANLGLENVGLAADGGKLTLTTDVSGLVDGPASDGTSGYWLYAVGDAAGKALLTHQGKYAARATGDAIVARAKGKLHGTPKPWSPWAQTANHHAVPSVVFTDPEVASVGPSLEQALLDGKNVTGVELPINVSGSQLYSPDYKGWAQIVVDEDRRVILGATFAGPGVAELLHAATIAIVGEVPLDRLWHAVPAFPTLSEVWLRLLEKYGL